MIEFKYNGRLNTYETAYHLHRIKMHEVSSILIGQKYMHKKDPNILDYSK